MYSTQFVGENQLFLLDVILEDVSFLHYRIEPELWAVGFGCLTNDDWSSSSAHHGALALTFHLHAHRRRQVGSCHVSHLLVVA